MPNFDKLYKYAENFAKLAQVPAAIPLKSKKNPGRGSGYPSNNTVIDSATVTSNARAAANPLIEQARTSIQNIINKSLKREPYPAEGNMVGDFIYIFATKRGEQWISKGTFLEVKGVLLQDKIIGKQIQQILTSLNAGIDQSLTKILNNSQKSGVFAEEEENVDIQNQPVRTNHLSFELKFE